MLSRNRFLVALVLLAIVAVVISVVATRWGVGMYIDSVAYVDAARNLQEGKGFSIPRPLGENQPVTEYAPLYPYTLAFLSGADRDPGDTARWLNALLYAVNVVVAGLIVYKITEKSAYAALLAAALAVFSPEMLRMHTIAMTEAVFLPFCYIALMLLAVYIRQQKIGYLLLASGLLAAALLIRFSGIGFIGIAGLGLLLWLDKPWPRRFVDAIILGVISMGPTVLWSLLHASGSAETPVRGIAFHMFSLRDAAVGVFTIAKWFIPEDLIRFYTETPGVSTPGLLITGIIGLVIGVSILVLVVRWLRHPGTISSVWQTVQSSDPLLHYMILTVMGYLVFIVAIRVMYDALVPFSFRLLFPMYIPTLVIIVYGVDKLWKNTPPGARSRMIILVLGGLFLVSYAIQTVGRTLYHHNNGIAYEAPGERASEIAEYLRSLPEDAVIYSPEPSISFIISGRPTGEFPWKTNWYTLEPIESYEQDLVDLRQALKILPNPAYVVVFTPFDDSASRVTEDELINLLDAERVAEFEDRFALVYELRK